MKEDNKSEKIFNWTRLGVKIIIVILLVACVGIYVSKYRDGIFLSFIAPVVFMIIFLLYDCLLVHFHTKGVYTLGQAVEFYTKCRNENLYPFQEENLEKAKEIYFVIFGTDKYCGEGTLLTHIEEIYNTGRKECEK